MRRGCRDTTREYCPVAKTRLGPRVCYKTNPVCVAENGERGKRVPKELMKASMMRDPALRVVVRDAYGVTILNVEQIRSN